MAKDELIELRRSYMSFMTSRVILTANSIGVFEQLKKVSSAVEAAKKLKADRRAVEILLDALTGIGLVIKSKDGKYRNAPVSNRYLVKGVRHYQGDIIRHASVIWKGFSKLDDIVRTGRPSDHKREHESFIMGMHNLTVLRTNDLIKAIGIKGVKTMLDLGGGPGTNAMVFAKRGVKAAVFDLPETLPIARRIAQQEGVKGLKFIGGDFYRDSIGKGYDLILISQIFHSMSVKNSLALLKKCIKALNPGGRVVVQEFPIDDTMTSPSHSALFSVNMLVMTEEGRCYTPKEIKKWLSETGFKNIVVMKLPETICVIGKKKG